MGSSADRWGSALAGPQGRQQTRALSWEACADVDHALSDFVGMMPWPRFAKILSAAVLEADPALAAERAERARTAQDVFSFDSENGLKTVWPRQQPAMPSGSWLR